MIGALNRDHAERVAEHERAVARRTFHHALKSGNPELTELMLERAVEREARLLEFCKSWGLPFQAVL